MVKFRKSPIVALVLGSVLACWCLMNVQSVLCTTPPPGSVEDEGIKTNSTTADPTIDLLEQIYHIKRNLAANNEKRKTTPEPSPVKRIPFGFLDDPVKPVPQEDVCNKSIARATLRDLMLCNEQMDKQRKQQDVTTEPPKCEPAQRMVTIRRLEPVSNETGSPSRRNENANNAESRRIEKLFFRLNGT